MRDNLIYTGKIFLERPFQIKLLQVMAAVKMFFQLWLKISYTLKTIYNTKTITTQDFYFFRKKEEGNRFC